MATQLRKRKKKLQRVLSNFKKQRLFFPVNERGGYDFIIERISTLVAHHSMSGMRRAMNQANWGDKL